MYKAEHRATEPKNFFAGDFPVVPESGTAANDIPEFTPVTTDGSGKIIAVTADSVAKVIGITAEAAEKNGAVVYYQTGEFFTDALNLPNGVTLAALKPELRKLTIFLR